MASRKCKPVPQGAECYINLYRRANGTVESNATHADVITAKNAICHDGTYLCTIKLTTKTEVV